MKIPKPFSLPTLFLSVLLSQALAQEAPPNHPLQAFLAEQAKHQATLKQLNGQLADLQSKFDADPNLPLRHEIQGLRDLTADIRALRNKIEKVTSPVPATCHEITAKYIEVKISEKTRELAARDKILATERAAISARIANVRADFQFAAQLEAAAAEQIRVLRQDRLLQKEAAGIDDLHDTIAPPVTLPLPVGFDLNKPKLR